MYLKDVKVGIIGLGRMGSIIAKRLLSKGHEILAYDIRPERLAIKGVRGLDDADKVAKVSDVVILAVKPKDVGDVLESVKDAKLIVSIAAGVPLSYFEKRLKEAKVVRAMPNILGEVEEAVTAICPNRYCSSEDLKYVEEVFGALGETVVIEEGLMDIVTGFTGGGPAYVFLFIEALTDAAVKAGLPRETALRMAARTVLGSAKLVLKGENPAKLRDMVATPGGVTIVGLYELEKAGIRAALMDAVAAAVKRAKEISTELEKA